MAMCFQTLKYYHITFSLLLILLLPNLIWGYETRNFQYYYGPGDRSKDTFNKWHIKFNEIIEEASTKVNLSIYEDERLAWTRTSFVQPQLMLHDKFLYDRELNVWTVDKYLEDVRER